MKVLIISDLSCMGRCSITSAIPIFAAAGIEAVPLPTALFSTQTGGIDDFYKQDLSSALDKVLHHWAKLKIQFDAILTGYLFNSRQVSAVMRARNYVGDIAVVQRENDEFVHVPLYVDPIMGDAGKLYSGFDPAMVGKIKALLNFAKVSYPNLTEAALLAGTDTSDYENVLKNYPFGDKPVIITGIEDGDKLYVSVRENNVWTKLEAKRRSGFFHGAGDVFSAVCTAAQMKGADLLSAAKLALEFVELAMDETEKLSSDTRFGLCFESRLPWLAERFSKL